MTKTQIDLKIGRGLRYKIVVDDVPRLVKAVRKGSRTKAGAVKTTMISRDGKEHRVDIQDLEIDDHSPFGLRYKGSDRALIPAGRQGDEYLFLQIVSETEKVDMEDTDCASTIIDKLLKRYEGPEMESRLLQLCNRGALVFASYAAATFETKVDSNAKFQQLWDFVTPMKAKLAGNTTKLAATEARVKKLEGGVKLLEVHNHDIEGRLLVVEVTTEDNQSHIRGITTSALFHHSHCTIYNSCIRKGLWEPPLVTYVGQMDHAIAHVIPPCPGTVYRGVNSWNTDFYTKVDTTGKIFSDEACLCSSGKECVAEHHSVGDDVTQCHPVLLKIQHFSGRKIVDYVAEQYKWEDEYLFPRKTRFLVEFAEYHDKPIDVHGRKIKVLYATLREIP
jgi:hypothetical protein